MARIVEVTWNCQDCGTRNILGRHKQCPQCGSPREKGEMNMNDEYDSRGVHKGKTVTDPGLLELARAGADWFCTHCGQGNRGDGDSCSGCGAPRYRVAEENHPNFPSESRTRDREGGRTVTGARTGVRPARDRVKPPRQSVHTPPPHRFSRPRKKKGQATWIAGGVFLALGVIAFLIWALQTHTAMGDVSEMAWSQTETVYTWTPVVKGDWQFRLHERPEVPPSYGAGGEAGVKILSCRRKLYETVTSAAECGTTTKYRDVYTTRTVTEPCTKTRMITSASKCGESCRDLGNGFKSCSPRSCTETYQTTCSRTERVFSHKEAYEAPRTCDIYKQWCEYETQEWQKTPSRSKTVSGTEPETYWPGVELRRLEKKKFSGDYTVLIRYVDRGREHTYTYKPKNEQDYRTWRLGDKVTLYINNLGGVSRMERGGQQ